MQPVLSLIALGANLRATVATFHRVIDHFPAEIRTLHISSVFCTRPVGLDAGSEFLNAAALVETSLSARELLAQLHRMEDLSGRERTVHWGPRTLDLDLLTHGQEIIDSQAIVVPHPAMWYRRFVMDPVAEIAGGLTHPVLNLTMHELHGRLATRPLRFEIASEAPGADAAAGIRDLIELLDARIPNTAAVFATVPRDSAVDESVFARIRIVRGLGAGVHDPGIRMRTQPRVFGRFEIEAADELTAGLVSTIEQIVRAATG